MSDTLMGVSGPGAQDRNDGERLSDAPPLPPDAERPARKHMRELMNRDRRDQGDPGMGRDSANPFVRKMMAMKNIEGGIRDAVAADPNLAGPMAQALQAMQQIMMGSIAGSGSPPPMSAGLPSLPPPALAAAAGPSPMPGPPVLPMPAPGT